MNIRTAVMSCLFLLILGTALFPQETGKIEYLEGIVTIHQKGKTTDLFNDDTGFSLYESDVLSTGADGRVEIFLNETGRRGTRLTIHENTVFSIETGTQRNYPETRLKVLHGSIGVRVSRLISGTSLNVQTESASMGVRGTDFEVLTGPDGSLLVICTDGRVNCTSYSGDSIDAIPGKGVEKLPAVSMKALPVTEGQEKEFIAAWQQTRKEVFRSGANIFVKAYREQWTTVRPAFETAYGNLMRKSSILEEYGRRAVDTGYETSGNMVKAKISVSNEIMEIRKIFSLYEQVYYRLRELESCHREGIGVVVFNDKTRSTDFFAHFTRNISSYNNELAMTRYLMQMFLYINRASGGMGDEGLLEDFLNSDPFEAGPSGNPF